MSEEQKSRYDRVVDWFDRRIGFSKTPLRPIPGFGLNPIYWLGLLMALCFVIQIITGIFQLQYYVPTPDQAYNSTMTIITTVPLGHLVETVHLYNAYAMILLAMLHLAKNYFGSVHKTPREFMWLAGWALFIIVLGMGFTGYLLPWTVISKSATDVAVGFLNFLPPSLSSVLQFLVAGNGTDADLLTKFFALHTVILPAALALFLGIKVYLFEVHGFTYVPAYGKGSAELHPWFPKVFLYALLLFSSFIAILLAVSAVFPLSLPPAYTTPQAAAQYVIQPDWYLLWVYQILKFDVFEGGTIIYALIAVTIVLLLLALLPLYDRSTRRNPGSRPLFVAIGACFVAWFVILTVWGYLTPGQTIPNSYALLALGLPVVAIAIATWAIFRIRKRRALASVDMLQQMRPKVSSSLWRRVPIISSAYSRFIAIFILLLAISAVSFATFVGTLVSPLSILNAATLGVTAVLLTSSFFIMIRMLKLLNYEGGRRK